MRITKAYVESAGLLTIEATSTNPNAILSVYSRAGNFMFELKNKGGGRYADQRGWVDNPQQVTVRSNFGGSATAEAHELVGRLRTPRRASAGARRRPPGSRRSTFCGSSSPAPRRWTDSAPQATP